MAYRSKEIGARIQALRKERNMTQEELAECLDVSSVHVANLERGRKNLTLELAINLESIFSVSLDFLIHGDASQKNSQHLKQVLLFTAEAIRKVALYL